MRILPVEMGVEDCEVGRGRRIIELQDAEKGWNLQSNWILFYNIIAIIFWI